MRTHLLKRLRQEKRGISNTSSCYFLINMADKIFIVGIDPGKSGGIVALTNGKITDIVKMPQTPIDLVNHFYYLGFPNQPIGVKSYVVIENVHSMPSDSSKGAFSFGRNVGQIEGVLASFGIEAIKVEPKKWQLFFGIKREKGETKYTYKGRLRDVALEHCPTSSPFRKSLRRETADAYLISRWFSKSGIKSLNGKG